MVILFHYTVVPWPVVIVTHPILHTIDRYITLTLLYYTSWLTRL